MMSNRPFIWPIGWRINWSISKMGYGILIFAVLSSCIKDVDHNGVFWLGAVGDSNSVHTEGLPNWIEQFIQLKIAAGKNNWKQNTWAISGATACSTGTMANGHDLAVGLMFYHPETDYGVIRLGLNDAVRIRHRLYPYDRAYAEGETPEDDFITCLRDTKTIMEFGNPDRVVYVTLVPTLPWASDNGTVDPELDAQNEEIAFMNDMIREAFPGRFLDLDVGMDCSPGGDWRDQHHPNLEGFAKWAAAFLAGI